MSCSIPQACPEAPSNVAARPLHENRFLTGSPRELLQALVTAAHVQVDTMLQREAAAQLPGNWCTFAQNCVMQLRDLEDAMQVLLRLSQGFRVQPWSGSCCMLCRALLCAQRSQGDQVLVQLYETTAAGFAAPLVRI